MAELSAVLGATERALPCRGLRWAPTTWAERQGKRLACWQWKAPGGLVAVLGPIVSAFCAGDGRGAPASHTCLCWHCRACHQRWRLRHPCPGLAGLAVRTSWPFLQRPLRGLRCWGLLRAPLQMSRDALLPPR